MKREDKLLAFYQEAKQPVSDSQVAAATGLTRRSMPSLRNKLSERGLGFRLTTRVTGGFNVEYLFQLGEGFAGTKCFDEYKKPLASTKIRNLLTSLQSESTIETCEAIAKLNAKGYWTNKDLADLMYMDLSSATKRKNTLIFGHGLVIHARGTQDAREFLVVGIDPSKKQQSAKYKPKTVIKVNPFDMLINQVFA